MKYYTITSGKYPEELTRDDSNEFFGNGWSVKILENKYFLFYISGSIQGQLKNIEIVKEDYDKAIKGKMSLDDFCIKYDIF
jgi:hypothetical protein